jgi:hypothetical protein
VDGDGDIFKMKANGRRERKVTKTPGTEEQVPDFGRA